MWEIKRFKHNIFSFYRIQNTGSQERINTIASKNKTIDNISKQIKVYSEQEHLARTSEAAKELYETFKLAILQLADLEVRPKKTYIAFVLNRNVVDIKPQVKSIKIWINLGIGELDDPKKLTRDVSSIGHQGNGDYELQVSSDEDLEYILSLVKQAVKKAML